MATTPDTRGGDRRAPSRRWVEEYVHPARPLVRPAPRSAMFFPLVVLVAILPGLYALRNWDLNPPGPWWGLRGLAVLEGRVLDQTDMPGLAPGLEQKAYRAVALQPPLYAWLEAAGLWLGGDRSPLATVLPSYAAGRGGGHPRLSPRASSGEAPASGWWRPGLTGFNHALLVQMQQATPTTLGLAGALASVYAYAQYLESGEGKRSIWILFGGLGLGLSAAVGRGARIRGGADDPAASGGAHADGPVAADRAARVAVVAGPSDPGRRIGVDGDRPDRGRPLARDDAGAARPRVRRGPARPPASGRAGDQPDGPADRAGPGHAPLRPLRRRPDPAAIAHGRGGGSEHGRRHAVPGLAGGGGARPDDPLKRAAAGAEPAPARAGEPAGGLGDRRPLGPPHPRPGPVLARPGGGGDHGAGGRARTSATPPPTCSRSIAPTPASALGMHLAVDLVLVMLVAVRGLDRWARRRDDRRLLVLGGCLGRGAGGHDRRRACARCGSGIARRWNCWRSARRSSAAITPGPSPCSPWSAPARPATRTASAPAAGSDSSCGRPCLSWRRRTW